MYTELLDRLPFFGGQERAGAGLSSTEITPVRLVRSGRIRDLVDPREVLLLTGADRNGIPEIQPATGVPESFYSLHRSAPVQPLFFDLAVYSVMPLTHCCDRSW